MSAYPESGRRWSTIPARRERLEPARAPLREGRDAVRRKGAAALDDFSGFRARPALLAQRGRRTACRVIDDPVLQELCGDYARRLRDAGLGGSGRAARRAAAAWAMASGSTISMRSLWREPRPVRASATRGALPPPTRSSPGCASPPSTEWTAASTGTCTAPISPAPTSRTRSRISMGRRSALHGVGVGVRQARGAARAAAARGRMTVASPTITGSVSTSSAICARRSGSPRRRVCTSTA